MGMVVDCHRESKCVEDASIIVEPGGRRASASDGKHAFDMVATPMQV
ncbi:hypothetical protein RBWH47_00227 [Rhodopirellula baltica WH47]|uniref:Uncharacterized protein n=1 Tax=Rhodopirellula baltica WH47 TaxID=991778 RepID=F2AT06_RHOBT|nr:hypothetical protein RBWH47_00227 [Rhodopirellula baltica WH47]